MRLSTKGRARLKKLEGFRGQAYQCSAGVWTIGYGFTKGVRQGDTMTREEADARLDAELAEYETAVWSATRGHVSQNEFDAMVLLAWNIGIAALRKSTVLKAHNKGDKAAAARAFGLWNKITSDGKLVASAGLTSRRAQEAALYLEPIAQPFEATPPPDMPQAVAPEKPLTHSTTVIAGGTAAVATAAQLTEQVSMFKYSVDSLGDWLTPVLLVVTLAAVGWVIYERFNSRRRGNA